MILIFQNPHVDFLYFMKVNFQLNTLICVHLQSILLIILYYNIRFYN